MRDIRAKSFSSNHFNVINTFGIGDYHRVATQHVDHVFTETGIISQVSDSNEENDKIRVEFISKGYRK